MRPLLLDLFCGAGGAGEGYRRAGFDVVGVDIEAHDYRPGHFIQGDALTVMQMVRDTGAIIGRPVMAVHASPPCQRFSTATSDPTRHPDLITPLRPLLVAWGGPYVIENVPAAPLIDPVRLCGSAFDLGVRRHRMFDSNAGITGTPCRHAMQEAVVGVYGDHPDARMHLRPDGTRRGTKAQSVEHGRQVMGVDWPMAWRDLKEAIPPAYSCFIGKQLFTQMQEEAA